MHKFSLGLAVLTMAAAPALAQTPMSFADVDLDASGELSFTELQAVWPDLTEDEFNAADLDANGSLNVDELNALQPSSVPAPIPDAMDAPATPLDPGGSLSDTSED
jgi:hypothetical protein